MAPQYKFFSKCAQTYTDYERMLHIMLCLKEFNNKPDDDFEVAKANLLTCTSVVQVMMRDINDKVLKDVNSNMLTQEISRMTNASKHSITMDKWRVDYKSKEEERQKFIKGEKPLRGLIPVLGQVN